MEFVLTIGTLIAIQHFLGAKAFLLTLALAVVLSVEWTDRRRSPKEYIEGLTSLGALTSMVVGGLVFEPYPRDMLIGLGLFTAAVLAAIGVKNLTRRKQAN